MLSLLKSLAEVGNILLDAGQIVIATASDLSNESIKLIGVIVKNQLVISLNDSIEADLTIREDASAGEIIEFLVKKGIIFNVK
jgi:hypothetical protein